MSNRTEIETVLLERLAAITVTGGYHSDAGAAVFVGDVPMLGPDDPDAAIAVVPGDDNPRSTQEQVAIEWPIHLFAIAKDSLAQAWALVESQLEDLKKAIEKDDAVVGRANAKALIRRGSTRTIPREPGTTIVGVSLTYWVSYTEVWGNP